MKKTIAQELGITKFPFEIKDKMGNLIYLEQENGFWERWEVDLEGRELYYEDSDSFWRKTKRDDNGNRIYYECSDGFWQTWEMDEAGEVIYSANSIGKIIDNRPQLQPAPTITLQHCLDRGFTVEKVDDPIYKEKHGKEYKICYLKLSKRHMIDYDIYAGICMIHKVDKKDNIIEKKYIRYVNDLDFYIDFLASKKVLHKLYNSKLEALKNSKPLNF
jgi:hypothetical protein